MNITIETSIERNYKDVFLRFDLALFKKLKPPGVELEVLRFDGCKKGDEVHLLISKKKWISHIIDFYQDDEEVFFVDRGVVIFPPLKKWIHVHKVKKTSEHSCIIVDDIEYTTGNSLIDRLIYPALLTLFSLRRPIYKRELS